MALASLAAADNDKVNGAKPPPVASETTTTHGENHFITNASHLLDCKSDWEPSALLELSNTQESRARRSQTPKEGTPTNLTPNKLSLHSGNN